VRIFNNEIREDYKMYKRRANKTLKKQTLR